MRMPTLFSRQHDASNSRQGIRQRTTGPKKPDCPNGKCPVAAMRDSDARVREVAEQQRISKVRLITALDQLSATLEE